MKKGKLKWWLAGGFLAAAATVNFQVAANRESACAMLFAENVDAKTGPIDSFFKLIRCAFDLGERAAQVGNCYYKLDVTKVSCPDLPLANGTMYYGNDAAKRFMEAIKADGNGTYSGLLNTQEKVSYSATLGGTKSYSFDFDVVLHFDGLYEIGLCHPTTADDPNKLNSCKHYDDCATLVELRAPAYRTALGL